MQRWGVHFFQRELINDAQIRRKKFRTLRSQIISFGQKLTPGDRHTKNFVDLFERRKLTNQYCKKRVRVTSNMRNTFGYLAQFGTFLVSLVILSSMFFQGFCFDSPLFETSVLKLFWRQSLVH